MASPQPSFVSDDKYEPIRELQRQQQNQNHAPFSHPETTVVTTAHLGSDDVITSAYNSLSPEISGTIPFSDSLVSIGDTSIPHQGFGTHVESTGKISEIFAQSGKISITRDCLDGMTNSLPFSLWDVTYGTHSLDTNDLTNLFLPGDLVAFTARVERKDCSEMQYWYRVMDVARIGEHADTPDVSRVNLEEGFGTVVAVREDEGVIKSERWGFLTFSRRALEVKNQFSSGLPVYELVRSGRTVRYRCCTTEARQKEWTVIAVTPNGEILSGQGQVILAQDTFAFVHSEEFGDIYVPFQAIRVPKDRIHQMKQARAARFKALKVGTEVDFQITKSLPHGRCRWRAVSLVVKT